MRISDWSSDVCSSDLFLLLHGFDSHEPIRRVEIAEILLIFDYIFADHLAGFVSVISASPKGLDKPCNRPVRSEEHTSELQSLMRISYAVFCLKKKNKISKTQQSHIKQITHNTSPQYLAHSQPSTL